MHELKDIGVKLSRDYFDFKKSLKKPKMKLIYNTTIYNSKSSIATDFCFNKLMLIRKVNTYSLLALKTRHTDFFPFYNFDFDIKQDDKLRGKK